jgi:hypothetical protein
MRIVSVLFLLLITAVACKDDDEDVQPPPQPDPMLIFKFRFDSTQVRLNNIGQPAAVPAGHGAQSPQMHQMSAHYIELSPNIYTALGSGAVIYKAPETTAGGSNAIDFSQSRLAGDGEVFFSLPLSSVQSGTYSWLRISLAYQNYDIDFRLNGADYTGRVASFIGFNTYISSFAVNTQNVQVNANKLQGYWAFESLGTLIQGQAPPGATTVPNPIFASSPVPQGSCVVTGMFADPLVITGTETSDKTIVVSLSVNNSFEWTDSAGDNIYEPAGGDTVVDMGVRGLIPYIQ